MIQMKHVVDAWGRSGFDAALVQSLEQLEVGTLPLQKGLHSGSYALNAPLQFMILNTSDNVRNIEAKVGIFYRSSMPGCACAGDPTVEDEQNEYCTVQVLIDKKTGEATISLVAD